MLAKLKPDEKEAVATLGVVGSVKPASNEFAAQSRKALIEMSFSKNEESIVPRVELAQADLLFLKLEMMRRTCFSRVRRATPSTSWWRVRPSTTSQQEPISTGGRA